MSYWVVRLRVNDQDDPWQREFKTEAEARVARDMLGDSYYVLEGTWMQLMKRLEKLEESLGYDTCPTHSEMNMKDEDGK